MRTRVITRGAFNNILRMELIVMATLESPAGVVHATLDEAERIIYDPDRRDPVVVVSRSRSGQLLVEPEAICNVASGCAVVVLNTSLGEQLGENGKCGVHSGAIRVVGAPDDDDAGWVFLTRTPADCDRLLRDLPKSLRKATAAMPSKRPRQGTIASGPTGSTVDTKLRTELAAAQRRIDRLTTDLAAANAALEACRVQHTDPVFEDPHQQFRSDLNLAWLRLTPPADRDQWALRDYTVGPDFIGSWDDLAVDLPRVLHVTVDFLTRRAYDMASRAVHQQSETRGGKPTRRADGATAYRVAVKRGTPSAPRLLAWELPDGTVELARVAQHDDMTIR